MNPNQGFQEGQEGYDIAAAAHSSDSDSSGACEEAYQACSPEDQGEGNNLYVLCEGISTDAPTRHYYVNVQNVEENDYNLNDQHIRIDPAFRTQIHEGNEQNISNFLSLPEIIPAKKRSKQQPLLDYTSSKILTSRDYITRLEELAARKEATTTSAKKKKEKTRRPLKSNGRLRRSNNKNSRRNAHKNVQEKNKRRRMRRRFLAKKQKEQLGAVRIGWNHRNHRRPSQQNPSRSNNILKHLNMPHYHTRGCTQPMQIPTPMPSTHQHTDFTLKRTRDQVQRREVSANCMQRDSQILYLQSAAILKQ